MSEILQLTNVVKEAACDIYKELGAGYNETIYEEAMALELRQYKINYDVEKILRYSTRVSKLAFIDLILL